MMSRASIPSPMGCMVPAHKIGVPGKPYSTLANYGEAHEKAPHSACAIALLAHSNGHEQPTRTEFRTEYG